MGSAARPDVNPVVVGKSFITQYYNILCNVPEHLHRFYHEISKVGRVGADGVVRNVSTLQGISEELKKLTCGGFKSAEIISYDAQESQDGGFILVVTGYFSLNDSLRRKFNQTFFLAPQENGYFVLNDILRFYVCGVSGNDSNKPSAINGNKGPEQAASVSVKPVPKEVSKPLNNEYAKENVLVPEIVNKEVPDIEITRKEEIVNKEVPDIEVTRKEVADDSPKSCDPEDGHEDVPKKSYASVLKVVNGGKSGVPAGSLPVPKQIPKEQEHQVSSAPCSEPILKDPVQQASPDPSPVIESEAVSETVDAAENGHNQEFEVVAEGTSIYVKHLPTNATIDMLETEFKQFGAIGSGGIQVVSQRGLGFPYGFVEFEEADAAQRALEASPIMIGGQRAFVEEKRSTARGNNRGNGNGYGNRNVGGGRGRGSYGPYGYGNNNYRRGGGRTYNRRGNENVASLNSY
ncbi:Nuclear transport factor 2 [Cardamine amara subsp. amara]|uniref:Nuclear transport factor 2 n=1 Tax=Cardamine amara subsp. amara TaxID=228776 RepID=A0ABD1A4Y7_CARAN